MHHVPLFIAGYNAKFAVLPESTGSAFVPLDAVDNLDALLAVRYERTADNCGCFSFQDFTFQIVAEKPVAKKKVQFLFSGKTGFKACYDRRYYPVTFQGSLLPQIPPPSAFFHFFTPFSMRSP
jgi:hypothetical protein